MVYLVDLSNLLIVVNATANFFCYLCFGVVRRGTQLRCVSDLPKHPQGPALQPEGQEGTADLEGGRLVFHPRLQRDHHLRVGNPRMRFNSPHCSTFCVENYCEFSCKEELSPVKENGDLDSHIDCRKLCLVPFLRRIFLLALKSWVLLSHSRCQ